MTGNAVDFVPFAASSGHHAGLLLVCRDNDAQRDMTAHGIATAVSNVDAASGGAISDVVLVLNR